MLSRPDPYPAHVCKACGQEILRSEMEASTLLSGVVQCAACGRSGALNIEIRSTESKKPPCALNRQALRQIALNYLRHIEIQTTHSFSTLSGIPTAE